ncbi:MAG TPA: hypothetical protein PLD47_09850 [Aggregatilineales bacterium]|nr:hypothetical protein [Anaerolineales bacterium]HRE48016.1 hypothetical protein [Aggregatilineales bacterium]
MSAISVQQEKRDAAPPVYILKVHNSPYTLDPYRDRLESQGFKVVDADTYDAGLNLAGRYRPSLVLVNDDPDTGINALRWLEMQHTSRYGWLATTPLIILADETRLPFLRPEQLPDRVVVLQRRADTLNRLAQTARYLMHVWGLARP